MKTEMIRYFFRFPVLSDNVPITYPEIAQANASNEASKPICVLFNPSSLSKKGTKKFNAILSKSTKPNVNVSNTSNLFS